MSIQIVINNPGIIGLGDTVAGKIICTFHKQEHIRGIKCRFRGEEQTQWNQRRGKHNVYFTGKNTVIAADNNLIVEGDMTPGRYEYPFAYSLPLTDAPSSYTHQFGTIRYYIEALVDRPFAFDYRKEVTLHIVAPISLKLEQNMPTLRYQAEETVGYLCCVNGSISLDLILERDTYALGETINFRVRLVNNSDSEVHWLEVKLLKNIEFTTLKPSTKCKIQNDTIAKIEKTGVPPKDKKIYNISLNIPETTLIHNFSKCILFKQWFTLNVTAVLPAFQSNLEIATSIKVGHSLLGASPDTHSSTVQSASTTSVIPFVPVGLAPKVVTELPPPSYDDVIKQRI